MKTAPPRRRRLVPGLVMLATLLVQPLATGTASADQAQPVLRVASVNTPHQSGLLGALLPAFEKASGHRVEVYAGSDAYDRAEQGEADLVISHYGKSPVEAFVGSGKGFWPRPVFSNQSVLVGPKDDPAKVRGMTDPFEAMKKIVASGAPGTRPTCSRPRPRLPSRRSERKGSTARPGGRQAATTTRRACSA